MFRCNACTRRTLGTVFSDVLEQPYQLILTASPPPPSPPPSPHYSSRARAPSAHSQQPWNWLRRGQASYATVASTALSTPHHSHDQSYSAAPIPFTTRPSRTSPNNQAGVRTQPEPSIYKQAELERELRWLRDPLKLADRTVALLKEDCYFKALALVRLASRDLLCTVSWNHLIDWNMSKGKVNPAVKLYNEMKKRAQVPDARTFTTLFRGCAWHAKTVPTALEKTLSIYHSMFHDNAPVKPSIIHTNAVLKVCALAGDMDALLGVAAKLPERGNGAPDTLSYTIILNAVRNSALVDRIKIGDSRSGAEKGAVAVSQGRKLWEEIRTRWMKGDLFVDEELVCAAGRVLLLGGEADADDVLSLLEQTMGIPRQVPRIGDPARYGVRSKPESPKLDEDEGEGDRLPAPEQSSVHPSSATQQHLPPLDAHVVAASPFAPLPNLNHASFIPPGHNTLSLALEACTRMSLPRPAQDYWGLLTSRTTPPGYAITPDSQNYQAYLRLLRLQRASKLAVALVEDIRQGRLLSTDQGGAKIRLEPKVFKMAMSACKRDKLNPHVLGYASSLVRTMLATLEDVDPFTLTTYLKIAIRGHSRNDWQALLAAEREVAPGWRNLKSLVAYGSTRDDGDDGDCDRVGSPSTSPNVLARARLNEQVTEFAATLIGLYDRILASGREKLDKREMNRLGGEKARVSAWLARRQEGMEKRRSEVKNLGLPSPGNEDEDEGDGSDWQEESNDGGANRATTTTRRIGRSDPALRKLRDHTKPFSFRPGARNHEQGNHFGRGVDTATAAVAFAKVEVSGESRVQYENQDQNNHHRRHRYYDDDDDDDDDDDRQRTSRDFAPDPRRRRRRPAQLYSPLAATANATSTSDTSNVTPNTHRETHLSRRRGRGVRERKWSETGLRSDRRDDDM